MCDLLHGPQLQQFISISIQKELSKYGLERPRPAYTDLVHIAEICENMLSLEMHYMRDFRGLSLLEIPRMHENARDMI